MQIKRNTPETPTDDTFNFFKRSNTEEKQKNPNQSSARNSRCSFCRYDYLI